MTGYFPAPALMGATKGAYSMLTTTTGLVGETNKTYPNRDHASDGWIGDPSHAARVSQHNPCWTCEGRDNGIVRAVDIDSNGAPGEVTPLVSDVLRATIGDPRVWYVIFNEVIYSRTHGFAPKAYVGPGLNPHDHHLHVSLLPGPGCWDTSPWLDLDKPVSVLPSVRLARVQAAARHPRREYAPGNVRRVQRALAARAPRSAGLYVDGIYGPATRDAMARFSGRREPDRHNLARLGKGQFRLIT